ncbi:bcl-2-like protein 11 isoform 2-T2 [Pholidichthys leucotaenia]
MLRPRPPSPPPKTAESSGRDPPAAVHVAGASTQTSRSSSSVPHRGEPDSPSGCRTGPGLGVFQTRSIFPLPRRSSSGYFSFDCDSWPSSPLSPRPVTADKATQTPSLTCQLMNHALQRVAAAAARGDEARTELRRQVHSPKAASMRQRDVAADMQAEIYGQQLRRIGDDYNTLLMQRAGGNQPLNNGHRHCGKQEANDRSTPNWTLRHYLQRCRPKIC